MKIRAKKSSITNEKKYSNQTDAVAVVSALSIKSSFTVLSSLRRSKNKKMKKLQKSSTLRTLSSLSSPLSLSLNSRRSKRLQKKSAAHTTSSSNKSFENKPCEMKPEEDVSAPDVQPTTLFDHITVVDIVESLSTEAEETKEPDEDAKVEDDDAFTNVEEEEGPHTAAKNDKPIAVENKPTTHVSMPVLEEEYTFPDIEAAHTNEEPPVEAVLRGETIAIGIHKQSIPVSSLEESPNTWSNVSSFCLCQIVLT